MNILVLKSDAGPIQRRIDVMANSADGRPKTAPRWLERVIGRARRAKTHLELRKLLRDLDDLKRNVIQNRKPYDRPPAA